MSIPDGRVAYPVTECNACGTAIQGPMLLLPTGTHDGAFVAAPFHAQCAAQSFASEGVSRVTGAGRWFAELANALADPERSPRKGKRK